MSSTEAPNRSWFSGRSTTLKDIAQSVGVSESTASVVLNGTKSGTRVSQATRQAVLETAQRMGYRPNVHARSLQTGRSNRLGVYSGRARMDARNLFFAELLGGMLEGSLEVGTNTVVHTSGTSREDLLNLVSSRAVDGLVAHLAPCDPILAVLDQLRVPVVAVADRLSTLPSICVDDTAGGMLVAQHLASLGHKHVLVKQASVPAQSAIDRIESFVRNGERLGMRITIRLGDIFSGEVLTAEDVQLVTRDEDRATAIFGWSDRVAEAICHSLTAIGLRIPDDVAVVGFDGFHSSFAHRFELTTIRAPWTTVGRVAVSTLTSLIRGESVPEVTVLPVEFVRGTTS